MVKSPIDQDNQIELLKEAHRVYAGGESPAALIAVTDELLKNDPACDEAMFLAGVAHLRLGNEGLALQFFNLCSQLKPNVHAVWHNLARCLSERHPDQAYEALLKAQGIAPDDQDTLIALTNVCSQLGRHQEAIDWWERSVRLYGHDDNGAVNASFALLHLGRWEEGWKAFRCSLGSKDRTARNYTKHETPRWKPGRYKNAVVVLYGEQGIGDEIMLASMIPKAIEAAEADGSRLIIECDARNELLFAGSFPGVTVYGTRHRRVCEWPADEGVTHKLEFGGLGELFAPEPFRGGAYLLADEARVDSWAAWVTAGRPKPKPLVGIAWTAGSWATGRARRSAPFKSIAKLMHNLRDDVDFVCLEYEDRREDLAGLDVPVLNPYWATRKGADYSELAALVDNLDLVIAPTTSVVDLCGALGKPCWALVDAHPQWRYSECAGHDKMYIYNSVRCYRQQDWGEWDALLGVVEVDLCKEFQL